MSLHHSHIVYTRDEYSLNKHCDNLGWLDHEYSCHRNSGFNRSPWSYVFYNIRILLSHAYFLTHANSCAGPIKVATRVNCDHTPTNFQYYNTIHFYISICFSPELIYDRNYLLITRYVYNNIIVPLCIYSVNNWVVINIYI